MGMCACDRRSCNNIMCDILICHNKYYVCVECYNEITDYFKNLKFEIRPHEVEDLIEKFLNEETSGRFRQSEETLQKIDELLNNTKWD
jgi:hypothetical protein